MITWPIFIALILAYFAVRYTINMEEAKEEKEAKEKNDRESEVVDNDIETREEK